MTSRTAITVTAPSRVVARLDEEWRELVDRTPEPPPVWRRHLALAGCPGLDAVLARASRGDDEVLRPLLVEAHQGDALAGRVVLQALLGRLVGMARRDREAGVDDYVAALWCVLASYPLARRPARIAANLALDTLKTVHRERAGWGRAGVTCRPVGDELERLLEIEERRSAVGLAAGQDGLSAASVIEATRRLQLIDEVTGGLLHHVHVEGLSGRDAALRAGTSAGSLRVRCHRGVRRLAAHAPALLEAA